MTIICQTFFAIPPPLQHQLHLPLLHRIIVNLLHNFLLTHRRTPHRNHTPNADSDLAAPSTTDSDPMSRVSENELEHQ